MRTTDRLTFALLKQRITRALADMRAACEAVDFTRARLAEQEMNEGLDLLGKRLGIHAR